LVTSLVANLIPKGIAILQYADDTILCLDEEEDKARNVKLLLYMFEQMAGLKINFEKSEIMMVSGDNNVTLIYANYFNCQIGLFPLKYLGVSIAASRLDVVDWAKMEEKSVKKLDIWQGNSLSIAGRTTLINSSLINSTIYRMPMFAP
jgi:hypothetical protein